MRDCVSISISAPPYFIQNGKQVPILWVGLLSYKGQRNRGHSNLLLKYLTTRAQKEEKRT